jgi:hypothetical protein
VAPLLGGAAVGGLASAAGKGRSTGPDLRDTIIGELELLDRIPEDQVIRRAALERTIEGHIDDGIVPQRRVRRFGTRPVT